MTHPDGAAGPHVLVVDDDDLVRDTIVDWLDASGFCTTSASSMDAALEMIRTGRIAVLVSDYNLASGTTGVQLALAARAFAPNLPIVFVTGNPQAIAEDVAVPDALVVTKSTGLAHVVNAVRTLLNKSAAIRG